MGCFSGSVFSSVFTVKESNISRSVLLFISPSRLRGENVRERRPLKELFLSSAELPFLGCAESLGDCFPSNSGCSEIFSSLFTAKNTEILGNRKFSEPIIYLRFFQKKVIHTTFTMVKKTIVRKTGRINFVPLLMTSFAP